MEDDAELITQFLKGNRMAGSLLVARHQPALLGLLVLKTRSRDEAEDVAQSVWSLAIVALPQLKNRSSFRAWLFKIAQREFVRWLRQCRERPTCSLDVLQEGQDQGWKNELYATREAQSSNLMNATLDRLSLHDALAQLSEDHRETFVLRYVSQLSAVEAAEVLGVPVGTVESRCHFARKRLLQALQLQSNGEGPGTSKLGLSKNPHAGFQKT